MNDERAAGDGAVRSEIPEGDLSPVLLDRAAFLERLGAAMAADEGEPPLWVQVVSLPSLHLLSASSAAGVVDRLVSEIVGLAKRTWPAAVALGWLPGDVLVAAGRGERRELVAERQGERGDRVRPLLFGMRTGICHREGDDDAGELLRKARLAHFVASRAPGRSSEVYDDAMDARVKQEAALLDGLVAAIEKDALALAYQPKVHLTTRRLVGCEALVRWPGRDAPPIDRFIDAAENSGVVVRLGEWALDRACRQAAEWRDAGRAPLRIAVNLSPLHFYRADVAGEVRRALERRRLDAEWLELEITETAVLAEGADVVLREIADLGVTLALDDFGVRESALGRLANLPIHRLKIDRSFVRACPSTEGDRCLVPAFAAIGKSLGIRVLAEGVETPEHERLVVAAGCDEAQGHLYARSLAPDDFDAFAHKRGLHAE